MGIPLLTSKGIVFAEKSVELRKKDKLTGRVRKVAIVDTVLAILQVLYAQFRLLRPDHPLRRDVFTQFMDQSFIFPVMLFALITLNGILAVRLFFATRLVGDEIQTEEAIKRCRWWCRASILFIILSLLDLYVIVFLLAFDAYRRFVTIAILTFVRLLEVLFRICGIYLVGKLQYFLENPWMILEPPKKQLEAGRNSGEYRLSLELRASLVEAPAEERPKDKLLEL